MTQRGPTRRTLMRQLGEFVGHIVKGVRTDPARRQVVRREVKEAQRDHMILRRTTIEEIEFRDGADAAPPTSEAHRKPTA